MPVPIRCLPDYFDNHGEEKKPSIDYSFLFNQIQTIPGKKTVMASNQDASVLYEIWLNGNKMGDFKYKITEAFNNKAISTQDIMRLKTRGFITSAFGDSDEVEFTLKGRSIIKTMSLGEPNKFLKSKKTKNYSEILASMNKKGKAGYRTAENGSGSPKFRASNSNSLDLRKF